MIPANQLKEYSKKINSKKGKIHNTNYGECKKVILFTNARNEKNIKEWAAHHLLIGFSAICIFDHKSDPPIGPQFINFDKRVKVLRVEYENPVKLKLMNMAATIATQNDFDWMLYLDADEFLILNSYNGVKQMLNNFSFAHLLSINWLMFGTNHIVKEPSGLIIENYTKSEAKLNKHVKCFVRPKEVKNVNNPHYYNIKNNNKMYNIDGKKMELFSYHAFHENNLFFQNVPAYISHYFYQSEETYIKRKIQLPQDDTGNMRGKKDPNIHFHYNDVTNEYPKNKYLENIKLFLKRYE
jgi:mRNA-degrading endonuclease HigB of HigAB toxin-antitoxin module